MPCPWEPGERRHRGGFCPNCAAAAAQARSDHVPGASPGPFGSGSRGWCPDNLHQAGFARAMRLPRLPRRAAAQRLRCSPTREPGLHSASPGTDHPAKLATRSALLRQRSNRRRSRSQVDHQPGPVCCEPVVDGGVPMTWTTLPVAASKPFTDAQPDAASPVTLQGTCTGRSAWTRRTAQPPLLSGRPLEGASAGVRTATRQPASVHDAGSLSCRQSSNAAVASREWPIFAG